MTTSIFLIIFLIPAAVAAIVLVILKGQAFEFQIEDITLSSDELERHAENLAKSQETTKRKNAVKRVRDRLNKKYEDILSTYEKFNRDVSENFPIPPAAEWLLDNFYIIEEQKSVILRELSEVRQELPVIAEGSYVGFPRIYTIAIEIVSHIDGNTNDKIIKDFITAYQRYSFLSIEELWLLILMVKAALLEKLWVVCGKMRDTRQDWYTADEMVKVVIENNEDCDNFERQIKELDQLTPAFVEYLIKKLRKKGSKTLWMIDCLDSILDQKSTSTDKFISIDHHNQAVTQVSIGNVINSLRTLSGFDSTALFEELNEVERILKQDPCGTYSNMDFNSRNQYRNNIVRLASRYKTTEINIARLSLKFAMEAYDKNEAVEPENHVGYYLIGKGQNILLEKLNRQYGRKRNTATYIKKNSSDLYISAIAVLTVMIALIPASYSVYREPGIRKLAAVIIGILSLIPVSEIVIAVVNSCINRFVSPCRFSKLELKDGIPDEFATMVIVPTLVPNIKRTLDLIDNLEVFYLANKSRNLYFSLVGDFKDANEETLPDDRLISDAAFARIKELNEKYSAEENPIFYFFCRKRLFNEKQNKWMGWERKRGAIIEFNRLLRADKVNCPRMNMQGTREGGLGRQNTSYCYCSAQPGVLPDIKYVITLDADTQLPLDTAKQLVGTMIHPLNKAVFDEESGIVREGYGILQPRIDVNIESANVSYFTKIYAGQGGIDPYTTAVSDVYQDAFGEGIFTGKGIYDVDIFQKALDNVIPENAVLSHDLLEGSYLRTGLVTDVELIDGYPARYNSYMMRLHRWTRGDWQLLPWIFGRNPLSTLSRWKMIDNLRRSLLFPVSAIILLLCLSALNSSCSAWIWTVILSLGSPVFSYFTHLILSGDYRIYIPKRSATVITGVKSILVQLGLILVFLPYQAYLMANAIVKTLIRVYITKENLLEWVTAADMELALKNDLISYYRRMWFSPVFGAAILALASVSGKVYFWWSSAVFLVWAIAPWIAYYISKSKNNTIYAIDSQKLDELKLLARKTWCYFDEFAGPEENYLPADNFQAEPYKGAAHRTSPTNIGLLLVSNLAARDMGYIDTIDLMGRIEGTVGTIGKMDKWNGHLFNWYNTTTLEVLRPRFVSTVDSGNFIGYLMVLKEGLLQYKTRPAYDETVLDGFFNLLELCNREIDKEKPYFDIELLRELVQKSKSQNTERQMDAVPVNLEAGFNELTSTLSKYLDDLPDGFAKEYWVKKLEGRVNLYKENIGKYGNKVFGSFNDLQELIPEFDNLISRIQDLIDNMKFKGLFDEQRNLFSIGFDVEEGHLSKSYYDLFASEARQTSLIAIARGEINKQHWFKLGRKLVRINGRKGLVSWTGTMFEYLMPRLLVKCYPNTLIGKTYEFVVNAQINYGMEKNIPWGISESCYSAFDISLNYQYRAFGVPHLGLKRGLVNDMVVAPYATIMAIDIAPGECLKNIERFRNIGAEGKFGLYEAVDFTRSRLKSGQQWSVVQCYMVHHQGMSMLAFVNFLRNNIMQDRFHRNPQIRAVDSLIQEKFPANVVISKEHREQPLFELRKQSSHDEILVRDYTQTYVIPKMHLLTNGSYNLMITEKGNGFGKCNSLAVYRWKNDYMQSSGAFIYLRNVNSNDYWSTTFSPVNIAPEAYKVVFSPHKAEYIRREGNVETNTEVVVSTEDNTEIRRVTVHNHSSSKRVIELTSYMEVVLSQPEADAAHPAFSKLFVKTEYVREYDGLLAVRRKRDDVKQTVWGYHTVSTTGKVQGKVEYETDRMKFIGRNRTLSSPKAMEPDQPLSNSVGPVLDPVFSLRIRICIEPGESAVINFCTGICDTRKMAFDLLEKYNDPSATERVIEMAWTRSIVEAGFININARDEKAYLEMLPKLLYGTERRSQGDYILKNTLSQPDLWPFGISGDVPIVLITVESRDSFEEIQWALKMHDYFRLKGITVDLVILITDDVSYSRPVFEMVRDMAVSGRSGEHLDKRGGIFIRNAQQMNPEQKNLLFTCAKIVIDADKGLGDLISGLENKDVNNFAENEIKQEIAGGAVRHDAEAAPHAINEDGEHMAGIVDSLKFFNGLGGFTSDGNEYVICLKGGDSTPAPWVNIISNNNFGFICTESGGGYTWHQNSSQNKLTPWLNDPVIDTPSEIIYLHHMRTGDIWSCTPSPVRERGPYVIRHGFGYTSFSHTSHGVEQELIQFAAAESAVKISIIRLKNITQSGISLDLAYYLQPVLGVEASQTSPYIVTSFDKKQGILYAENVYSSDFRGQTAFLACSEADFTYTGDRLEFLGQDIDMSVPAGMKTGLKGTVGAGLDPCAAIKIQIAVKPGETRQVVFLFGQGELSSNGCAEDKRGWPGPQGELSPNGCAGDKTQGAREAAQQIVGSFRNPDNAQKELDRVRHEWEKRLKQIQVDTTDASMNIILNGWLQYQVLSSRVFARTGFYQAGGAYGFRDQLQDVMSIVYTLPEITRNQILLHCRHQFIEGDVQHWWHNQKMNGIRTRYSDDLLWLPYVTCDYINSTGDYDILGQQEPYIRSALLSENEHERYEIPEGADITGSVYEHCIRAIDRSLRFGAHGIPLMGGGDWNDGMNLIGHQGKGESVWLGWFLYCVLQKMIPVCRHMGDNEKADKYQENAVKIIEAIEREAWDGSWYRRAYFDDGTPLGSIQNDEGRIDSLSQSWAAISMAAKSSRVEEAMDATEKYLIDRKNGLIKLLTPPFYDSELNPGYIKGYLPGVRENGGQYTHAATWVIYAFTRMGKGEQAWDLFNMINPINHARTDMECITYKVEPYVIAADVYAVYPNEGRGGWTWYTGAAGWIYRIALEHILGIKKEGNSLIINPCIPKKLNEYSVKYVFGSSEYHIVIKNQSHNNTGVKCVSVDGRTYESNTIELVDDGKSHQVEAQM